MQVILIQNIRNLGKIGDCVEVKRGYALHFLLPKGLALPSNQANKEALEKKRAELEKTAAAHKAQAQTRADAIGKLSTIHIKARVASEDKLYGSVGVPDIAEALKEAGCPVETREVCMPDGNIHALGEYDITLQLGEEVTTVVKLQIEPQEG